MMKSLSKIVLLLLTILVFNNCRKDSGASYMQIIQIVKYIPTEDFRAMEIGASNPQKISKTGKIYIYKNYLFINEPQKGIHVYDNSNPSFPVNIAFINIPGNVDMAVNSNILYADSYIDLLAFDITSVSNIRFVKRINDVFRQFYYGQNQNKVVTYKDTLVSINTGGTWFDNSVAMASSAGGSYGQGGSMARFTLMNNYLYTVSNYDLGLFNVQSPSDPIFVKKISLGWGIETIFPYDNKLFIGTNRGMHIYQASDAENPVRLSTYSHVFSCDPVVVQGKYAYVTLRTGTSCQRGINQLEVIDIEDATNPKLAMAYPMKNPHGLSVTGSNLFLCEGEYGLKSFDISDKTKISDNLLQHLKRINSVDVIAGPKSLIVTGPDGIYQFNYKSPALLRQLSKIIITDELL